MTTTNRSILRKSRRADAIARRQQSEDRQAAITLGIAEGRVVKRNGSTLAVYDSIELRDKAIEIARKANIHVEIVIAEAK